MSAMPRPSEATKELFRAVLPLDDRVTVRPMFGQLAGFVNGHMFAGLFGDDIFVRPGEQDRAALLGEPGAAVFEPTAGRPMKDHVLLPNGWRAEPGRIREWIERALDAAVALPPKTRTPSVPRKAKR